MSVSHDQLTLVLYTVSLLCSHNLALGFVQATHCVHMRNGVKFGDTALVDTMLKDGLTDAFNNYHMGITAENVAKQYGVSREDQDKFAAESQQRTEKSQKNGVFTEEIIPVTIETRKGISKITSIMHILYTIDRFNNCR